MSSASFARLATVTASTKRAALSSGKRGTPTTKIASLNCLPLDPVSAELRQRLQLDTPHEVLQTFVDADLDIIEGDTLTVGGVDYPIRAVEEWSYSGAEYLRLVLENLKR
jgi:hypothetical protein